MCSNGLCSACREAKRDASIHAVEDMSFLLGGAGKEKEGTTRRVPGVALIEDIEVDAVEFPFLAAALAAAKDGTLNGIKK